MPEALYYQLLNAGCRLDHHESDLYIEATPEARRIVKQSGQRWHMFWSARDQAEWIEVPFGYAPFWTKPAGCP